MTQSIYAVSGSTGAQGGATARALLADGHAVRALTRNVESPAANALRDLGAEVVHADFDDPASLDAALAGATGLFAMGTPFGTDIDTEIRQGRALFAAAAKTGVAHIVYTSATNADRETGVPHFESKAVLERELADLGPRWTVIGPAAFLDNWTSGWSLDGLRAGVFALPLPVDLPLAVITAHDIGAFAALALTQPERFAGRRIDIASDEVPTSRIAEAIAKASGWTITTERTPLEVVERYSTDLAAMFGYFTETGLDVDVAALRAEYPEIAWRTVDDWASTVDWR